MQHKTTDIPTSLSILDRLISFPTICQTPNLELINYVASLLEDFDIKAHIVKSNNGQNACLYATVGPCESDGIILSGHTDIVPVEGQNWTKPPFKLTCEGEYVFGRGTTDMKGFVACAIHAMLVAQTNKLKRPLHLALSYDEEVGCVGVRDLLPVLPDYIKKSKLCIVGEPTSMRIATGHKGKLSARANFTGLEMHSAMAPKGVNAIHLASDFINILRDVQNEIASMDLQDKAYDIPYTTLHVGKISGGKALNIVPNFACLDFEIRHLKDHDPQYLIDEMIVRFDKEIMSKISSDMSNVGMRIGVINAYPGLDENPKSEMTHFLGDLSETYETMKVGFGTEAGLFAEQLEIPALVCGPGSMEQGHKPDEYIEISQIKKCDEMLVKIVRAIIN